MRVERCFTVSGTLLSLLLHFRWPQSHPIVLRWLPELQPTQSHSSHEEGQKGRRRACFLSSRTVPKSCYIGLGLISQNLVTWSHQTTKQAGKYSPQCWQPCDLKISDSSKTGQGCSTLAQLLSLMSLRCRSYPGHCRAFSSIPGLYLLDASSSPLCVMNKNVPSHRLRSPRGQNHPQLRITAPGEEKAD